MDTMKFKNKEEFAKYVNEQAKKFLNEESVKNLGIPTDLKMNQNDGAKDSAGAQVTTQGKFKKEAPANIPKDFKTTKNPVDVKMEERSEGHDGDIATAAKIEGSNSKKSGTETNPFIKGQATPKVDSKKTQPNVTKENDPTKEGGVPGKKNNSVEMNQEDKEDTSTKPMTQVIGKGEIGEDGFSKGQTAKEVNTSAKNDNDEYEQKLRDSIKTIQLPENFKNKKHLLEFIQKEAIRISKII